MIAGVDCGAGGAFALVNDQGELLQVRDMPTTEIKGKRRVVAAGVREIMLEWQPRIVCVERAIAIKAQSAFHSMQFGHACGVVEGVITGMGTPVSLVYPITWKRAMGVGSQKGANRLVAQRHWPDKWRLFERVKDDGRAEAALIAMFQVMKVSIFNDDEAEAGGKVLL